ncbi:MAG: hypothetical protein JO036_01230 [Candidatus Eremiobacteraeota bacterium]|nr:hypothetical protein [Candidatus Eremiobacteraeota bacterium]
MKRISALVGGVVLGAALLASCGGGGGSGSSAPNGGPMPPSNTSAPSGSQAFTSSDAVAIPTPAPGAQTVPVPLTSDAASGAAANAAFPASGNVPPDTTVASTYSANADSSVPALARARVTTARTTRDGGTSNSSGAIAYLRLQFSADVTLPQAPAFTFTVPGTFTTANGVTYWLALYDPLRAAAGWQKQFEGPAAVTPAQTASGNAATKFDFASNGKPITFSANQTYYLVLLKVDPNAPSPTPIPSTVPTNSPEPKPAPVVASPTSLYFPAVSSSPVPVTFSQQGFSGTFSLHGDCTGIVNTNGASPTWTITPVGQGRCVIIGLGDRGASAVVHVGVVTPYETPRPSPSPTTAPTEHPSSEPTHYPTYPPTTAPTEHPSSEPTHYPTYPPTTAPTEHPSSEPTHYPTYPPTTAPTEHPTTSPTQNPGGPTPTPTPGSSNH